MSKRKTDGFPRRTAGPSAPTPNCNLYRTGSERHDHSGAADFHLKRDGQRVNPGDDKALYSQLIENSSTFFDGMGHYHWGMHAGGGKEAF